MKGIDIGCMLCAYGKGDNEHDDCVSCIRCIGRDCLTDDEGFFDNFKAAALALPSWGKPWLDSFPVLSDSTSTLEGRS